MSLQRISIGFHASPPLSLRVEEGELKGLKKALGDDGWHEVQAEDGTVILALEHVLYIRVDRDEQRVGFGLAG